MRLLFMILALFLTACADTRGYKTLNVHTGVTVRASDVYVQTVDQTAQVEARVVRLSQSGRERYLIKVFVLRNDRNFPKISDAYSLGVPIEYHRDDRHRVGALRAEAGHLTMTAQQAVRRAKTGYSFLLSGPRGSYPFNIPPHLFAQISAKLEPG